MNRDFYDNPKYLKDFYFGEYCVLEELVEKATPKKSLNVFKLLIDLFDAGDCPICGYELNSGFKYCPRCGQALDWSEE